MGIATRSEILWYIHSFISFTNMSVTSETESESTNAEQNKTFRRQK
jgi:hypothetical protein